MGGGSSKKWIITNTNLHFLKLFFSQCVVCILLFTPFLSIFFVFHRKDLFLLSHIGRYMTSTSEQFLMLS